MPAGHGSIVEDVKHRYSRLRRILVLAVAGGSLGLAGLLLWLAGRAPADERGGLLLGAALVLAFLPIDLAIVWSVLGMAMERAVRLAECLEERFDNVSAIRLGFLAYGQEGRDVVLVIARPSGEIYAARITPLGPVGEPGRLFAVWGLFRLPLGVALRRVFSLRRCRAGSWEREGHFTMPLPGAGWARVRARARVAGVDCLPRGMDVCETLDRVLALVGG